jgi:hypothetical protein
MLGLTKGITCQEMVELITDYLEDALPRSQRRRFEGHIKNCEHCTEYLDQIRVTISLTGRLREDHLTPEMYDEFTTLFRNWRAEVG